MAQPLFELLQAPIRKVVAYPDREEDLRSEPHIKLINSEIKTNVTSVGSIIGRCPEDSCGKRLLEFATNCPRPSVSLEQFALQSLGYSHTVPSVFQVAIFSGSPEWSTNTG